MVKGKCYYSEFGGMHGRASFCGYLDQPYLCRYNWCRLYRVKIKKSLNRFINCKLNDKGGIDA